MPKAARRLGSGSLALNFASGGCPGGGFAQGGGGRGQEEALCRASALWYCLSQPSVQPFYHDASAREGYSDAAIHTPRVPVIRSDAGDLLAPDHYYLVNMLTVAAPNCKRLDRQHQPTALAQARQRIRAILAVAKHLKVKKKRKEKKRKEKKRKKR